MRAFPVVPAGFVLAASLMLCACGDGGETPAHAATADSAYAAPPVVTAVAQGAGGALTITGRAGPDERIRLIDATGRTHGVGAGADGVFSVALPGGPAQDRLLSLSVQRAGRAVSSDGWLFSPATEPDRAVMLRPGAASLPVGAAPLLAVADYDGGGGLALSGVSGAGATVTVTLDGQALNAVTAGVDGRWFLTVAAPVSPGGHQVSVASGNRSEAASLSLSETAPAGAIEAIPGDGMIRVNWRLPGGGVQTTWILGA